MGNSVYYNKGTREAMRETKKENWIYLLSLNVFEENQLGKNMFTNVYNKIKAGILYYYLGIKRSKDNCCTEIVLSA